MEIDRELIGRDDSTELDQVRPVSWDDDGVGEVDIETADRGAVIESELKKIVGAGADSWIDPLKTDLDHTESPGDGFPSTTATPIPEAGRVGGASAVIFRDTDGAIIQHTIGTPDD